MAWGCLAAFGLSTVAAFAVAGPDLLRERAAPGPGVDRGDVALATLGFLGLYPGTLVVAGLDAGRSLAEPALPVGFQLLALAVFVLGYAFALWAIRANPFFATFVRIQSDRAHRVIDAGPYRWVRHPGYAGTLVAHAALPLALGSFRALAPALVGILFFALRTAREDRFLAEHLTGYSDYRARVRWRLIPGVW
ncbi:MAG: methyltransferase family protein [Myxococcota bacterium]